MTGWCPVHDRTYEADDGLCPRCGTALVTDEAASDQATVIVQTSDPEIAQSMHSGSLSNGQRRISTVAGIAAAILVAFVAGLAFPKLGGEQASRSVDTTPISQDLNIGVTQRVNNVALRLESFTQRARQVVLRLTVPPVKGLDLGRLRRVGVSFFDRAGIQLAGTEMETRTTVSGFILEGFALPVGHTPVGGVGIDFLSFVVTGDAETALDLRGAWPVTSRTEPRAAPARGILDAGEDRVFKVTGLVGWADRLEVGLSWSQESSWQYDVGFHLESGGTSTTQVPLAGGPEIFVAQFIGVPPDWRRATLKMTVSGLAIAGPWAWTLPVR